ncbi:hypothetical protein DPMN_179695 [Dreissena polymorpha]|uniref:Uncharacterized protein n=1 Tax=Dreissena polymorpha TaxID=45954 RepID=A0A9D4EEY8_DREPO|nr:hypothetical protein DPMN_179695 [Dreissena polymorpha]
MIDASMETGCFSSTLSPNGRNSQEPEPHGPGFPLQDPSVKAMTVCGCSFCNISWMTDFACSSWTFDLFLDEPRLFQYVGLESFLDRDIPCT